MRTVNRIRNVFMTLSDAILELSEGVPGAVSALAELCASDASGFLTLLQIDEKRLYGDKIWELYSDVCDGDVERFRYHVNVELPNQETGVLSITGPYSVWPDEETRRVFWNARRHGKPGSFWALETPPRRGYRFPLDPDGSEPKATGEES